MKKKCKQCGRVFIRKSPNQILCGRPECKRAQTLETLRQRTEIREKMKSEESEGVYHPNRCVECGCVTPYYRCEDCKKKFIDSGKGDGYGGGPAGLTKPTLASEILAEEVL